MAKRFTDTNKYKKKFVRGLQGPYKLLWDYLYHDCDHAGIWIVDFEIAQIYLGTDMPVIREDALKHFNANETKIIELPDGSKWFIPSFVDFQYGELNPKNKAHNSVINILTKYDLLKNPLIKIKGLTRVIQGDKDMDKDKELDKDNIKINSEALDFLENGSIQPQVFFQNNPHTELDPDSYEIVQKIIIAKNPNSVLTPDDYQLSIIKKFLLLNPGQKDILLKSIEGAEQGDSIKGNAFEVPNLTADYITNPKNQSRLIGYLDITQSDEINPNLSVAAHNEIMEKKIKQERIDNPEKVKVVDDDNEWH